MPPSQVSFVASTRSQSVLRGVNNTNSRIRRREASFVATTAAPGILRGVDWVTKHPSWRQQPLQASFVALTQSQSILRGVHKFQASFVAPTTPTVAYVVATHPSWRPQVPGILRGVDSVTKYPSWRPQVPGILRGDKSRSRHPSWRRQDQQIILCGASEGSIVATTGLRGLDEKYQQANNQSDGKLVPLGS